MTFFYSGGKKRGYHLRINVYCWGLDSGKFEERERSSDIT